MRTSTKQQPLLMRAATTLLLAMLTSATAWAWDGSGTKSDPYKIQNRADLVQLSTDINNSTSNLYEGTYFVQTADIDMSGVDFVPIGIDDIPYHRFRGNYDGKNYIIYNLTVNGSYYNAALFGYVYNGGIDNVWLVSPSITNTNTNTCYTGALIGYGIFPGIQNCVVINPTLSGGSSVGALAGWQSSGSIKYSYFTGNNNYDVVGYINGLTGNKEMGRAYTLTLADGITTSTAPAFSYGGTSYYAGTITLPAAPAGWVYAYSVNDSAIDGNTFDISADASVTVDRHISPLLGYNDDPLVDGSADHPYTITTTDGWNLFCDCLDDNDTWNRFSGKTVKLANNITVTRMAGGSDHAFVGTFDGQGHTLTVNYGSASAPLDAQFVAPFVEVRGNAEFFNLTIDGHIYAAYTGSGDSGVGGLIGHLFGGITIEGCTSTVEINSTKDRVGGFVGLCEHAVTFTNCKSSAVVTCTGSGSGFVGWSRNSEFIISFEGCLFNGKILKKNGVGSGNGGFVGWKGYTKTIEITDCLVDPAAVAEGETMADDNSATFCRYSADTSLDNQATSITNCYYIEAFGREQGTQAYSISKGEYVTTLEISGEPTNSYPVSGLDFYSVGLKCGDVLYAAVNNVVSLTLGCTPPSGYYCTGYTATGGTLNGTTLTMPNGNVTINATIEQLTPVDYVDENGEAQQCTDYILLTGTETYLGTPDHPDHETWYVVQGTLNYTKTLNLIGNTHIILADNAVMNGTGISPVFSGPSFSIYGQTGQSGELNVTSASQYALHVFGNITIAGGKVTASARYGIFAEADGSVTSSVSVTIKNATVTATGTGTNNAVGIGTQDGDITIDNSNVTATAQGTAQCMAFRLYGGGNVIFRNGGKTRAEGGYCGIFCQGNVTIEGCQVEIYGGNYGIETNNITLGWTNPTDYIYANKYYAGGTLSIAEGKTFIDEDGQTYSGTIAQADGAYPIDGKTLYPYSENAVPYLDENGQQRYCVAYTTLTGTETSLGTAGQETWYVVDSDVSCTDLTINGDIHLILVDGKTMNLNHEQGFITLWGQANLTIYGQTNGTGTLSSLGLISTMNITVNGGIVNVKGDGFFKEDNFIPAIWCVGDMVINGGKVYAQGDMGIVVASMGAKSDDMTTYNFTLNGGQVTAIGMSTDMGIIATGNITLGWTNPTDYIYANKYYAGGTLSIASSKTFVDENNTPYSGTIAQVDEAYAIDGKTLYPDCVVMKQVEGYEDSNGGWVFIASPVAGSIAPTEVHNLLGSYDEATGKYDYDLYRFNQSDANGKEWQNWNATTTENHPDFTSLVNGHGYLYATKETRTLVFAGEYTAATGPVEVQLVYDPDADLAGWNLVGNPFATQATMTDLDDNPVSFYVINGQNVEPYEGSAAIEPCTGVMVNAEGTGEKVRFTSVSPDQAPQPNKGSLQIALSQVPEPVEGPARNDNVYSGVGVSTSSTTLIDNAIISFNEGSKLSKFYFGTQNANIYIPQGNEEYAIAYSNGQGEMPLNFKAKENGTYTLTVSTTLNSQLSTFNYLHLIDNMTGADVDLLAPNGGDARPCVSTYTFTAKTTDYASRFKLMFSINQEDGPSTGSGTFAFISNGNLIVNGTGTLQVIDMTGRVLYTAEANSAFRIQHSAFPTPGVYVLRLINGENVRTQKIVVE